MMKNWRTTASGVLAALPQMLGILLPVIGVAVPPVGVLNGVSALGLFLIGLFAKDSNVTGGTITQ